MTRGADTHGPAHVLGEDVGHRVVALARYPVKSLQGETLRSAELDGRGLVGDRAWAVHTADGGIGSGKTTRRFRRVDGLLDWLATCPDGGDPVVTGPDGESHRAGAPSADRALSDAIGQPLRLRPESTVAHHDESPVHVLTTSALRHLEELVGGPVDLRRFRANLVLDTGEAAAEEDWSGRQLTIGDVVLRLGPGMPRCRMVDLGVPEEIGPAVLRTIGGHRGNRFGLQAHVESAGIVHLGDVAHLT